MTTTENNLEVANIIAQQIGGRAFVMMGTRYKTGYPSAISFDIRGAQANKIIVKLDPFDTYTVQFWKVPISTRAIILGKKAIMLYESTDIYADGICQYIEANTGLCLSL